MFKAGLSPLTGTLYRNPGVVTGMARLDPDFVEEGRRRVRQNDLDGLMNWVERSGTFIDHETTRKTFELCFRAGDTDKAMRLFNAVFPKSNPTLELAVMFGRLAVIGFIVLGLFGGILYAISALQR
jgi:hypothetical protein